MCFIDYSVTKIFNIVLELVLG